MPSAPPARNSGSRRTPSWRSSPAGSLSVKGVDVLVQAFAKVAADVPGARLVIVGAPSLSADPVEAERYARSLRDLGTGLDILWLEARKDVEPLIQMADVVVAPSRWAEPFSRSVIEPLACGVPVVATRVGGNSEILTDWLARYLVPADDVEALADRIASLRTWRSEDPGSGPDAARPWWSGSPSTGRSMRSRRPWPSRPGA